MKKDPSETGSTRPGVYRFSVVIEKDKDGYFAFTPELQGCYSQGDTCKEVIENIRDTIFLHVEDRLDSGEEVPHSESVSLTSLEVAKAPKGERRRSSLCPGEGRLLSISPEGQPQIYKNAEGRSMTVPIIPEERIS